MQFVQMSVIIQIIVCKLRLNFMLIKSFPIFVFILSIAFNYVSLCLSNFCLSCSEPVHEEMLNEQSNVVSILAPPASTFLGGSTSAVQIVGRERPAPNGVKIKVVTRRRQKDKPTQYGFHVDPDEDVASLRVLLADKTVDLPLNYHFYYDMAVMNESFSFRHYGIDGVRVPKIEVMDVTANSQLVILKRKNSQDDAGPSIHKTEEAKKVRNV